MNMDEYVERILLMMPDIKGKFSEDEIAEVIKISYDAVLNRLYPFDLTKTEIPQRYISPMLQIAVVLLNKQGIEGETAHKEANLSQSFEEAGIPQSMLRKIPTFAGVTIKA